MTRRQWALLVLVASVIALYFALDLGRFLNLAYLQGSQARFAALYAESPWTVRGTFFLIYLAATSLSMPGAVVLTLAGGGIFGLGWGLVLVSFASSLGATMSFWVARYALRDWVTERFGKRLAETNRGIEREGAFYLFTLRLLPVVPFFIINLAMGLTSLKARTFYWVSQLGMLAGTAIYVNAGTQLAQLQSLGDVLSPGLLGSLLLLGLFPLLARKVMLFLARQRVYARWASARPRQFDRNLVVIGAGAGGLVTAYIAAAVKAKVTLVEAHKMGGDCLNYGCVPSKALIRSAQLAHQMRHGSRYGLTDSPAEFDFMALMQRIARVISTIEPNDSAQRYTALGVEVVLGYARIVNPWTVAITLPDGKVQQLTTRSIVIAAGAKPVVPDLPGLAESGYVTSDTLWETFAQLEKPPQRLIVLGGGPIGCELAQSFARLGSQVTQVEASAGVLSREDADVSALIAASLQADGVQLLTSHRALRCERRGEDKVLVLQACNAAETDSQANALAEHSQEVAIPFDQLLVAVGRAARLEGYGLKELGIQTGKTVQTNEYLQTIYPNIYAAGDVAGPFQFTHTAAHQAWYAAVNALFGDYWRFAADYSVIPSATFTDPEVARVGLNESEARAQGIGFEVTRFAMKELDRAVADSETQGFIKVLTAPGKDSILGVTVVGHHAADLLAEYVLAMKQGLGLNTILGTIHTYPTMSEASKYAAGGWKRAHQPDRLLHWVRRFHAWRRGHTPPQ
jgi:pyruvate/2-oxoglutarate dehydrogenase complex dihydrolipoamide dehydrogenase (E3) component/uncharacterized membrane protein YdjX (TVP38/TMEM64 family)